MVETIEERASDVSPCSAAGASASLPGEDARDQTLIRSANNEKKLTIRIELDNGISFSINDNNLPLFIGRSRDCDIRIPQSDISRQHCELFTKNNTLFLRDSSTNGTIVGSKTLRGESVSINGTTSVIFAGDTMMSITPKFCSGVVTDGDFSSNRRADDRRLSERRTNDTVVQFERRTDVTRRNTERRVA